MKVYETDDRFRCVVDGEHSSTLSLQSKASEGIKQQTHTPRTTEREREIRNGAEEEKTELYIQIIHLYRFIYIHPQKQANTNERKAAAFVSYPRVHCLISGQRVEVLFTDKHTALYERSSKKGSPCDNSPGQGVC